MVNRIELSKECTAALEKADIPDAEFDCLCIFQDCLGDKNPLFKPLEAVEDDTAEKIHSMISRRINGEPLQYILGEWEFFGYPFKVGKGVLIPRPDTETLVENVIKICRQNKLTSPKIADLCAGSGCIAVTLKKELPLVDITAVELSPDAMRYLRANAELNSADIHIIEGDVLSPDTAALLRDMDIIVSNPPYVTAEEMAVLQREVRHEPETALFGGNDGLDFYREMTKLYRASLKNRGFLCYEFGDRQHEQVGNILAGNGFDNINFTRDLAGIIRTVTAQKQEDK